MFLCANVIQMNVFCKNFGKYLLIFFGNRKNIVSLHLKSGKKYIDNICPPRDAGAKRAHNRREEVALGHLLKIPKVEKKNVLIIYAPREMRERSERTTGGENVSVYERI